MLVASALAGCATEQTPAPTHTAAATDAPVFASDEEALAAATKAYAGFLEMSDRILMDGGSDPGRIKEYASGELATLEMESYSQAKAQGFRSTGGSVYSNMTIQTSNAGSAGGIGVLSVYLCSDVSAVDVFDSGGKSIVSSSRPDRTPFEVSFDIASTSPIKLLVASAEVWNGPGVC